MTKEQAKVIERCKKMIKTVFSSFDGKVIYTIKNGYVNCNVVINNVEYPDYLNNDE